ncbi:DUF4157 domain-containing protein [Streptomyces sp. NPDC007861]|uniref:eCIS core domain-containing protein n=1 Tax=Streptomyces sp. NPDC007861 TaxID=3154893 RepID=UPI0033F1017A
MRRRQSRDRETDSGVQGRPTRPSGSGTSTQGLPGLPLAAGNAAVVRAVEAGRHEHGPGCGHAEASAGQPTVQRRSTVGEALAAPGVPLDPRIRAKAEEAYGMDFGHVRVHTGPVAQRSAEELGAAAYTTGAHIVSGRRRLDDETMYHEVDHVYQQAHGPVSGTENGAGLKVSSPSDAFEVRAAANGRRMARGAAPDLGPPGRTAVQRRATPLAETGVQRMPSTRPTVNAGTADEWEAHNTPGRTDGLVLSGHGSWTNTTADFRVPAGTRVHLYCQHGNTVLDANGARVETGTDLAPESTRDGRHTIPDYTLHVPSGLDIHGTPVAVTVTNNGYAVQLDPTQAATVLVADLRDPQLAGRTITFTHDVQLSAILQRGMGDVHFAACRHLDIPALHGRTRNQS